MSDPIRIEVALVLPPWLEEALRRHLREPSVAPPPTPAVAPAPTSVPDRPRASLYAKGKMTPERVALATRMWRDEHATLKAVLDAVNALPGPPLSSLGAIERALSLYKIRRGPRAALPSLRSERDPSPPPPALPSKPDVAAPKLPSLRSGRDPLPPLPALPSEPDAPAPRLPAPGLQGRIAATRFQIRTWSAYHLRICHDGSPACLARINDAARTLPGWDARTEIVQLPDGEG